MIRGTSSHFGSSSYAAEPLERRVMLSQYGLSSSFGDGGVAVAEDAASLGFAALRVQENADHTITLVGIANTPTMQHVGMARFDSDGNVLDQWVSQGLARFREINSAVVQADGKIVIAGMTSQSVDCVARLTTSGELDTSFAGDGILELDFDDAPEFFESRGAAVDGDGRIILLGDDGPSNDRNLLIARFTPTGVLDSTFDDDGAARFEGHTATQVAVQADGRIVVLGSFVGRITEAGAWDTSFSGDGVATFSQLVGYAPSMLLLADGKMLLAEGNNLWRITAAGALDSSFGEAGVETILEDLPPQWPQAFVDDQGAITVLDVYGVSKLTADGQPDPDFGISGRLNNYGPANAYTFTGIVPQVTWRHMALAENGDILMSGQCNEPGARLARFQELADVSLTGNGTLMISGGDEDDEIVVDLSDGQARVSRNGVILTYAPGDVTGVDVLGADGDDEITIAIEVPCTINSGAGDDTIITSGGHDQIDAGDGNDSVTSGAGNDSILAGAGNNLVDGESGNDTIQGGVGNDTLVGGAGNDHFAGGGGVDSIDGGSGDDSITATGGGGDLVHAGPGDDDIQGGTGDDTIFGESGNDRIHGEGGANQIHGGDGDDYIRSGDGSDTIWGDVGNDYIYTGVGNNLVWGGEGNDSIKGGPGNDTLWGEIGYDTIKAGDGDDLINGGAGKDRLFGQEGNDNVYGRRGNDSLDGGPGDDRLVGDQGFDKINGGEGNDRIWAADGEADLIDGGDGNDAAVWDDLLDSVLFVEGALV